MPRRNTRNNATDDRNRPGWFHVYNRARNGRKMFIDDQDRCEFVAILKRHLGKGEIRTRRERKCTRIEGANIVAGTLMATHFHLVIAQSEYGAMTKLLHAVLTAYVRYFNKRHGLQGPMFNGPYRARRLKNRSDLKWAIAYVHFNPQDLSYGFSTHNAYLAKEPPPWIRPALEIFNGKAPYRTYIKAFAIAKDRLPTTDQLFSSSSASAGASPS